MIQTSYYKKLGTLFIIIPSLSMKFAMKRVLLLWMITLISVRSQISSPGVSVPRNSQQQLVSGVSSAGTLVFQPPEDVFLPENFFTTSSISALDSTPEAAAATAAHVEIKKRIELEKALVEQNITIEPNTAASFHLNLFQSTPQTIAFADSGLMNLQTSIQLVKQNNLTAEQGRFALSSVRSALLVSDSQLADSCQYMAVQCPNPNSRFRTINGSCTNLKQPSWGMIDTPFQRIIPAKYHDGVDIPRRANRSGEELPSARIISQQLTDITDSRYTESMISTLMLMQWGQFLDHDIVNTALRQNVSWACCQDGQVIEDGSPRHPDCFPIRIPANDTFFAQHKQRCMEFKRSLPAVPPECKYGPREQKNVLTAFIDGSQIYGSDEMRASELRTKVGGQMKIQRSAHEDVLLPPQDALKLPQLQCVDKETKRCFIAGDFRVNEQPQMAVTQTIWLREHNRIATELQGLNPGWDDERLYQESRRIVGAEIQQITYNEYFPILLGDTFMSTFKLKSDIGRQATTLYDQTINPSITNEFATAAFRMGHSQVQGIIKGYTKFGVQSPRHLVLHEHHFNPLELYEDNGVETLVRGLLTQATQKVEQVFSEEIRNHLFQPVNQKFGLDLVALNVQRGRDHGLPPYNDYRELCGKTRARSWEDFHDVFDRWIVDRMKRIYGHIDDVDLYIGGVSERPVKGAILGPTFLCLIGDQAVRLRRGDRFFFEETTAGFTPQQLANLRQVTLARILCDNSVGIESIQPRAFFNLDYKQNHRLPCNGTMIPKLALKLWQERTIEG